MEKKDILVTGDRPTGNLHLGHYVGTLENRIKLQNQFDCFFLIADLLIKKVDVKLIVITFCHSSKVILIARLS